MCKTVTRMANDVNAWDLFGNAIKLICEDYLIHNTLRTLRAWIYLLVLSLDNLNAISCIQVTSEVVISLSSPHSLHGNALTEYFANISVFAPVKICCQMTFYSLLIFQSKPSNVKLIVALRMMKGLNYLNF